jgi:hypothetical protein
VVLVALAFGGAGHAGVAPAPAPVVRDGMGAHVDPRTGRFRPDGPALPLPATAALPGPATVEDAPGGGKMVRLRGRFIRAATSHVDPDGSEHADCVTADGPSRVPAHP